MPWELSEFREGLKAGLKFMSNAQSLKNTFTYI